MKAAQQQIESPFCALCNTPLDPDTPPGRKVCDGCMGNDAGLPGTLVPCSKCKRVFPQTAEYFYRATDKKTGFQCECKGCHNEAAHKSKKTSKKPDKKVKPKPDDPDIGLVFASSISKRLDPVFAPDPSLVTIDLSPCPGLLAYLTDLSRDQERSLEGQIRWILRQCHKYQSTPWSKTEAPSAECGES